MSNKGVNTRLVPLSRCVAAAIIDTYEDMGKTQQIYSHWAARAVRKLMNERTIRYGKKKVIIPINENFSTGDLPPDFGYEMFIGVIADGKRIPIEPMSDLVGEVEEIEEHQCAYCNQDKGMCEELEITESTNIINIRGQFYEEKVTRRMEKNGNYYEIKETPYVNQATGIVEYHTTRKFVTKFDILKCGCVSKDKANTAKLKEHCPDIYDTYCCDCSTEVKKIGYKIMHEEGRIQFSPDFPYEKIYMEYAGFMPKLNGQYMVPEIAFETVVALTKFKSVENKRNIPLPERDWYFRQYMRERGSMEKAQWKFSLSNIMKQVSLVPKFEATI